MLEQQVVEQQVEAGAVGYAPSLTLPDYPRGATKPLLRGWLHALAACVTLLFTVAVIRQTWEQWPRMLALLIFAGSSLELYTVSAVFHLRTWRPLHYVLVRTLDHCSIFVAIAGSYTPLALALLDGWLRILLLSAVWILAALGIVLKMYRPHMSRWLSTGLYVGLGWVVVLALPAFWTRLPTPAVGLLLLGGLCYTNGALIYGWRWPDPFPRIFGFHELFHLLVVAGAAAMGMVIWIWIAPLL